MPDLPDDYPFLPNSVRFPLVDLGELAARLGSPVVYDRRGEVLLVDDFHYGIGGYDQQALGTGAAVDLVNDITDAGPFAVKLTAGSDGSRRAELNHYQTPLAAARYGFEVSFYLDSDGEEFELVAFFWDGSVQQQARIRYLFTGGQWSYYKQGGGYTNISLPSLFIGSTPRFHWAKLVVDFSEGKYVRFLLDDGVYGFINVDLRTQASALDPGMAFGFQFKGDAGENDTIRVGRFIITANEP